MFHKIQAISWNLYSILTSIYVIIRRLLHTTNTKKSKKDPEKNKVHRTDILKLFLPNVLFLYLLKTAENL